MKMKMMILFVAAFAATAAFACPPCDEPWPGINNCTEQDRFWYCCIHTDQCYLEDRLSIATKADWQTASTSECQSIVAEPGEAELPEAELPEALREQATEESAAERT